MGVMVCGMVLWFLVGLASEIVLMNARKKTKVEKDLTPGDVVEIEIGKMTEPVAHDTADLQDTLYKDVQFLQGRRQFHLNHKHGLPFRDFSIYCCIFVFFHGYASAMDEANGESSLCFQWWPILRKLLKIRAPIPQAVRLHDNNKLLKHVSKSSNTKTAVYLDDHTHIMVDIRVDSSMLLLSPRLYDGLVQVIHLMNDHWIRIGCDRTVAEFFEFYDDGTFVVKCGDDANAGKSIDISYTKSVNCNGSKISMEEWLTVAKKAAVKAKDACSKNLFGLHCSKGKEKGKEKKKGK